MVTRHLLDEHLLELRPSARLDRLDDQVRLTRDRREAHLSAAVSVGAGEPLDRRSGHQEGLQNAALDDRHTTRPNPLVVVLVEPGEVRRADATQRRVGVDRETRR